MPARIEPIRFAQGEIISVGHRGQQWTACCRCTAQDGERGLVPESCLEQTGPTEAVAGRDYDGTELTVAREEVVDVPDDEGGWMLCRTSRGVVGWLLGASCKLPEAHARAARAGLRPMARASRGFVRSRPPLGQKCQTSRLIRSRQATVES